MKRIQRGTVALVLATVVGCADGNLWLNMATVNPYIRRKWQEDEQFGPTYYTRIEELQAVRASAPKMSPQQQDLLAFQLSELLRQEENPLLRREAVLSLGHLATPSAVPALQAALQDADADVRLAACQAWGKRGGVEAAATLAELVRSDQDLDVRIAATAELSRFRGPDVSDALLAALEDSDPALQYRAVKSLRESSDRDYGENVHAWREYLRGNEPSLPSRPSLVERFVSWF